MGKGAVGTACNVNVAAWARHHDPLAGTSRKKLIWDKINFALRQKVHI
jgi:hypothetical protein